MARDIRTRLTVDGEAAFKRAISDASKSIGNMGSQLTLAAAQFKKDGDAMKLMQSRSAALRGEIGQQQAIVKALSGAVEDATEIYGENSVQVEKWQADLNRAQAKLIDLQNELSNNEQGLDKTGKAFGAAGDQADKMGAQLSALDKIQQSTTFQALNTAIGNIERGMISAIKTAKEFSRYVWGTAVESSNWADELATLSAQTGISARQLQQWAYAADYVDTDINDIVKAMTKLQNPTTQVADAMRKLHVAQLGVNLETGEVVTRASVDRFWEALDALNAMTDATEQENIANTLFGKSFREVLPLIKQGRQVWEQYGQQAEDTGNVLEDRLIENLTKFNDSVMSVQNNTEALKNTISAELAPGLTAISDSFGKLLSDLTLWAQSEDGQKALQGLSDAISALATELFGQVDFTAVVDGATAAINGLTGALSWIKDNQPAVVAAVGAIAAAIGGIKVARGVLSTLALFKMINWGNISTSLGGSAAGEAITQAAGGGAAAAGGAAAKHGLLATLKAAAPFAGFAAVTGAASAIIDNAGVQQIKKFEEEISSVPQVSSEAAADVRELAEAMRLLSDAYEGEISPQEAFEKISPETLRKVMPGSDLFTNLDAFYGGDWRSMLDQLPGTVLTEYAGEMALKIAEKLKEGNAPKLELEPTLPDNAGASLQTLFNSMGVTLPITPVLTGALNTVNRLTGSGSRGGGTYNNQTYNNSRSIYIDKYNQYSAQDVDALMVAMDDQNRYARQGRGA